MNYKAGTHGSFFRWHLSSSTIQGAPSHLSLTLGSTMNLLSHFFFFVHLTLMSSLSTATVAGSNKGQHFFVAAGLQIVT